MATGHEHVRTVVDTICEDTPNGCVCLRCRVRAFLRLPCNSDSYALDDRGLTQLLGEKIGQQKPGDSTLGKTTCCICLGILDSRELQRVVDAIVSNISKAGFDVRMEDLRLNIALPACLIARSFELGQRVFAAIDATQDLSAPSTYDKNIFPSIKSVARNVLLTKVRERIRMAGFEKTGQMISPCVDEKDVPNIHCKNGDFNDGGMEAISGQQLLQGLHSQLHLNVSFEFEKNESECKQFQTLVARASHLVLGEKVVPLDDTKEGSSMPAPKRRKKTKTTECDSATDLQRSIKRLLDACNKSGTAYFAQLAAVNFPLTIPTAWSPYECMRVEISRPSIFLTGKYIKFLRGLPQSPWFIMGKRVGESSVQELLCDKVASSYGCSEYKFHSSGREDIDVRMLGNGRPYAIELINPKKCPVKMASKLPELEKEVNQATTDVRSIGLYWDMTKKYAALEVDTEDKRKTYVAVCCVSRCISVEELRQKIDRDADVTIMQNTPLRVLHRRTLMQRPKIIHSMKTEWLNERYFILHLVTSSGTYVKEFVHGDMGRTLPNVGSLLSCEADILQLDVVEVTV